MESLKVYYDEVGQTLTIWFGDPQQEFIAEETAEEVHPDEKSGGSSNWH